MNIFARLIATICIWSLPLQAMEQALKEVSRWTPLIIAVNAGDIGFVQQLLYRKVSIDEKDKDGFTALIHAAENGSDDIVRLLLRSGATVNLHDDNAQRNPLYFAACFGHASTMKILVAAGATIDHPAVGGATPLVVAAKGGHVAAAEFLLSKGANKNTQDSLGRTPLGTACQFGKMEVVKVLLAAGADLKKGDPLQCAAQGGHTEIIGLLLAAGVDVNTTDAAGQTALLLATGLKHKDATKKLLEHEADPNWSSSFGAIPLTVAAINEDTQNMKALLAAGAIPEAVFSDLRPIVNSVQDKISCAVCKKPTNTKCGGCKSVYYCSKEHQLAGWPAHKTACKAKNPS